MPQYYPEYAQGYVTGETVGRAAVVPAHQLPPSAPEAPAATPAGIVPAEAPAQLTGMQRFAQKAKLVGGVILTVPAAIIVARAVPEAMGAWNDGLNLHNEANWANGTDGDFDKGAALEAESQEKNAGVVLPGLASIGGAAGAAIGVRMIWSSARNLIRR
jgi:hypothetical protein